MNNKQRKEFYDFYMSDDITNINKIIKSFPSSLIKFCNGSYINDQNYYLDALRKQKLWFSSPRYFNDPFDCVANINFEDVLYNNLQKTFYQICEENLADKLINLEEFIGYRDWIIKRKSKIYAENIQKLIDSMFICCFSEPYNLASLRMWGHYANSHKGFCLEYDTKDICKMFNSFEIMPILYNNEYSFTIPKDNKYDIRKFQMELIYTKAYEWNYEKEWRLCIYNTDKMGVSGFLSPFTVPKSAFLGCKIENRLKKDLLEICFQMKITPYEVYMTPNTYKLNCRKIDMN